jgi:hypothetical protein
VGWVYIPELDEIREVLSWIGCPFYVYDCVVATNTCSDGLESHPDEDVEPLTTIEVLVLSLEGVPVIHLEPESYAWLERAAPPLPPPIRGQG